MITLKVLDRDARFILKSSPIKTPMPSNENQTVIKGMPVNKIWTMSWRKKPQNAKVNMTAIERGNILRTGLYT
jgi:hypothetical protein